MTNHTNASANSNLIERSQGAQWPAQHNTITLRPVLSLLGFFH